MRWALTVVGLRLDIVALSGAATTGPGWTTIIWLSWLDERSNSFAASSVSVSDWLSAGVTPTLASSWLSEMSEACAATPGARVAPRRAALAIAADAKMRVHSGRSLIWSLLTGPRGFSAVPP